MWVRTWLRVGRLRRRVWCQSAPSPSFGCKGEPPSDEVQPPVPHDHWGRHWANVPSPACDLGHGLMCAQKTAQAMGRDTPISDPLARAAPPGNTLLTRARIRPPTSNPTLGYRTYRWGVQGSMTSVDPNVLLGLIARGGSNTSPTGREIDSRSRIGAIPRIRHTPSTWVPTEHRETFWGSPSTKGRTPWFRRVGLQTASPSPVT